jgi:hypothetical protein
MLCGLADQLDVIMPPAEEIDRAVVAHVAKLPTDFTFGDERFSVAPASFDELRINYATESKGQGDTKILSGGGTWLHDPQLAELRS